MCRKNRWLWGAERRGDVRALEATQLVDGDLAEAVVLECADERVLREPVVQRVGLEAADASAQSRRASWA